MLLHKTIRIHDKFYIKNEMAEFNQKRERKNIEDEFVLSRESFEGLLLKILTLVSNSW